MLVCDRKQWSREYFLGLPYDEIMDWLAWEMQRRKAREKAINEILETKSAELIRTRALLLLLQSG